MRGDRQKISTNKKRAFSPWVSFWKDGDRHSLANFSFHLPPEIVKQFNMSRELKRKIIS
jgi:hypothetical protein